MRLFKKHNADLELVGKIDGVGIYKKKNLFDLPSNRAFTCLRELYFINNWSASKEEVLRYIEGFEKSFNEQRLADAATFVKVLKIKAQQQPQEESLINLAANFYYLKHEQDQLTPANVERKKRIFADLHSSGFFLTYLLQLLTEYKHSAQSSSVKSSVVTNLTRELERQENTQKKK